MTDLIIDGNSLYARAWYATAKDFIDANTVLRSALQTVFSLINKDVDRIGERIDRVLFCWDGEHGRDKGDRQAKPAQYYDTRELLKELVGSLLGAAHATPPRHEADDAVATAVERSQADLIFVVSGDKDLMQLHAENVRYYCLNNRALLSRHFVTSKFGVKHPRQIAIAQAVIGDKIDNVPGIRGWGPAKVKVLFECVTENMSFEEALEAVVSQIPQKHLNDFYSSLERTLLDPTLNDMPEPAPLKLATVEEMLDCGVTGIEDAYIRMYSSYTGRRAPARVAMGMDEDG
jgi:5'-3' exonuclease